MTTLVGLGKAYELAFFRTGSSVREVVRFPSYWWAWSGTPSRGDILLVKPGGMTDRLSALSTDAHLEFHGEEPTKALRVEAPSITGAKTIGLVESFAYDARGLRSNKSDKPYRHHFGAETKDDQPPFPTSDWPALCVGANGSLIIKRRGSNGFRLADWVIG